MNININQKGAFIVAEIRGIETNVFTDDNNRKIPYGSLYLDFSNTGETFKLKLNSDFLMIASNVPGVEKIRGQLCLIKVDIGTNKQGFPTLRYSGNQLPEILTQPSK